MKIDNIKNNIEKDVKEILNDKGNIEMLSKNLDFNNAYAFCYLINTKQLKDSFAICWDEKMEDVLLVKPYTTNNTVKFQLIDYYNFNFDDYFFRYLENEHEIGKIYMAAHYAIWSQVTERYPNDITFKNGMQKYLKYCKDNSITKDKINKECSTKMLDNVMKYYQLEKKNKRKALSL